MALWQTVDASLYASGQLWLPNLSLRLMGRDWACLTRPFDWWLTSAVTAGSGGFTNHASLSVCYPDNWGIDESYVVAVELSITVRITGVAPGDTCELQLSGGNNTGSVTGGAGTVTLTKVYTDAGTLPTGVTTETIQERGDPGTVLRTFGFFGPDSYIRAYVV